MVVVATGAQRKGAESGLDWPLETICADYSRVFSWDLEFEESDRMTHPGLIFRTTHTGHGYQALKLFDLGEGRVRANFLTFWSPKDKRRQELMEGDTLAVMAHTVEGLIPYAGPFRITSPIEESVVHLTRPANPVEAGLVLAGDAAGEMAPSAALGLRTGLHDVRVLAELMPRWEREARSSTEDISTYYSHPAKIAVDGEAFARSIRERKVAIDWRPEWATLRLMGDQTPDWLESVVVRPAVLRSLNLVRGNRSGLAS
jgi:2-polyprenyl-6-methoxyphenol hydroxylase-like FAD-dependent oxidoreductase